MGSLQRSSLPISPLNTGLKSLGGKGGGGGAPIKMGEDARREILNWPLKGTNLGVA